VSGEEGDIRMGRYHLDESGFDGAPSDIGRMQDATSRVAGLTYQLQLSIGSPIEGDSGSLNEDLPEQLGSLLRQDGNGLGVAMAVTNSG
jgi:hypothetical protein